MKKFYTFDIEAEGEIFGNKFVNSSLFGEDRALIFDNVKDLIKSFEGLNAPIYAHYGGTYDFKFLLEELLKNYEIKFKSINGKFAKIAAYSFISKTGKKLKNERKIFELRDSSFLLPPSLGRLAADYNIGELKQNIDRTKIKELSKAEVDDYVMSDSRILFKVLKKFFEETECEKLTIASFAYSEWKKTYDEFKIVNYYLRDVDYRKAYYGGRVDVFKKQGFNLMLYDVKSMYPYVMLKNKYPIGQEFYTLKFMHEFLGIYNCRIKAPEGLNIPLLPFRKKEKLLFCLGEFEGWYCSAEILKARELGYIVEVIEGYYWIDSGFIFNDYIEKWYKVKETAKGAKREIAKLLLNSLYGKFGQRREFADVVHRKHITEEESKNLRLVCLDEANNLYQIMREDKKPITTTHIACFVTCYARLKLYSIFEDIQKKGGAVYYCDTDSVVSDISLNTGKGIGDLELQANIDDGIFINPKLYALKFEDKIEIKAKGFNSKELCFNQFERALNNDFSGFVTHKNAIIGFLEGMRRKMTFLTAIKRERQLMNGLSKRETCKDGINTVPYKSIVS